MTPTYDEILIKFGTFYTHDSIKIKPNTLYRVEYDYETHYISGTHKYGFKLALLASDTSGVKADLFETIPYVNTSQGVTHVKHEFKTPANAQYLNISPVIYGHWGDKNLNMKAWVDNLSLVEVSEKKPTQVQGGIRYIRDWANGSSANAWNFWVEIEALDVSGNNRALGKTVTGSIPENTGKPYSRITDGKIGNNSYFYTHPSTHSNLSNIQVDLGEILDIEKVKIYHYYTDGRTFRDTKTEVSADGVNWTTLFDSAVDGTYAEPKDGSGRSYEVIIPKEEERGEGERQDEIDIDNLDTLLESLFSKVFGTTIQSNIEISGILSPQIQDQVDSVIDRFSWDRLEVLKNHTLNLDLNSRGYSQDKLGRIAIRDYIVLSVDQRISGEKIHIVEYEYTSDIEDGYIGGFYFKVNNPDLVKEAGLEYYNATLTTPSGGIEWDREVIEGELTGEFSSLILPQTSSMIVRGYVIDNSDNKVATKNLGDIIHSDTPVYEYYNLFDKLGALDSEGIQTSAIPIIAYYGVIALFNAGLTIYDTYTTIQDCRNDDFVSINCAVDLGLSVIPVKGGKQLKNVLEFAGSSKKQASSVQKITSPIQNLILTKSLLGKTLKTADGKSLQIPTDWKKYSVTGNGGGARYVSPDGTKQIRVMGQGLSTSPYTHGKPYFRIEKTGTNEQLNFDFTSRSSWTDETSHYLINQIQ